VGGGKGVGVAVGVASACAVGFGFWALDVKAMEKTSVETNANNFKQRTRGNPSMDLRWLSRKPEANAKPCPVTNFQKKIPASCRFPARWFD
jgi:hypothetical protein